MSRPPPRDDEAARAEFVEKFARMFYAYIDADPKRRARFDEAVNGDAHLVAQRVDPLMREAAAAVVCAMLGGLRESQQFERALRIAEALQVRPPLTMTEVFRRAGVSRSAGYRILDRMNKG